MTLRRKVRKLGRTLLPGLAVLVAVLAIAAPATAQDTGAGSQYDRTPTAGCDGYAPNQYCPGYAGPDVPPQGGGDGNSQYPQYPQYPLPRGEVVLDLDGDGEPESAIPVGDADGAVDEEDVSAVVGDVFFVYAADGAPSAEDGTPPSDASGASDEEDVASVPDEDEGGEIDAEATGDHASGEDVRDDTSGPDEETVGNAERAASSEDPSGGGEPESGPGRIALFALGAGTLLVANGLLARWIVG